jgi:Rho termination factor, N-terminal domain/Recombination endonuclease VII
MDLSKKTVLELKQIAKEKGLKTYSKLNKKELINLIEANNNAEISALSDSFKTKFIAADDGPNTIEGFFKNNHQNIMHYLEHELETHNIKVQFIGKVEMIRHKIDQPDVTTIHVATKAVELLNSNNIDLNVQLAKRKIITDVDEFQRKGSGWTFNRVLGLDINISRYNPIKGSSYIELPKKLKAKKACINVQNDDEECFRWAILSSLFTSTDNQNRTSKYKPYVNELNWNNIKFPTPVSQASLFENNNSDVSLNIFDYSEKSGKSSYRVLHHTKERRQRHVDLLLIHDDQKFHYVWIKDFNKLMSDTNKHKARKFFCTNCFHPCSSQEILEKHFVDCRKNGWRNSETVDQIIKFRNFKNQLPAGFVIYADSEALIEKMFSTTKRHEQQNSFIINHQRHVPCSFAYVIIRRCCNNEISVHSEVKSFRGENAAEQFLKSIVEDFYELQKIIDNIKPLKMTPENWKVFHQTNYCHICGEEIKDSKDKFRDHCHLCGKFRGAAHNSCNYKLRQSRTVSCFFHNFKGYDAHSIMRALGAIKDDLLDVNCIPNSFEKYTSVSLKLKQRETNKYKTNYELVFKDSYLFLNASLDKLISNSTKFQVLKRFFPEERDYSLLLRKGIYPYEYMSGWHKFSEKCLPSIDNFRSKLKGEISAEDYSHAINVWKHFSCENIGQYHDLYLKTDVLLLADVFENFRSLSLDVYALDPCHYFTLPGLSWDSALKITKAELPTLKDRDMHDMIAKGIRGGVSMISHRYAKANNKHLAYFDPNKPSNYLIYLDANNLYGHSMLEKLPYSNFTFIEPENWTNLRIKLKQSLEGISESGYILEVDLEYPKNLHDDHNDYPLAPEKLDIKPEMLSAYNKNCMLMEDGCLAEELMNTPTRKLVTTLLNKERYVVHYKNLLYDESKGMRVKTIHRVLQFKEKNWLGKYINLNNELRTGATTEFEKDFYKLMNNSVFGKTMENVWKRVNIKLVTNAEKARKLISSPWNEYGTFKIFTEDLVAVHMPHKKVILDKPIYTGFAVLELSKLHMYKFHYDVVKEMYGHKAKLLFTDTDSLCYTIETDNIYTDLVKILTHLDMSGYPKDHPLYSTENKKKLGKFKDELCGQIMREFIGLRSKLYAYNTLDGDEQKKAKGVTKSVIKASLSIEHYKNVLFEKKQAWITMNILRSKNHEIFGSEVNKIGLSPYDDKRYILHDGIHTLAYGHYKIQEL